MKNLWFDLFRESSVFAVAGILFCTSIVIRTILQKRMSSNTITSLCIYGLLIVAIAIAQTVLQRPNPQTEELLREDNFDWYCNIIFMASCLLIIFLSFGSLSWMVSAAKIYHRLVILPIFIFMSFTFIPITFLAGTTLDIVFTTLLLLITVILICRKLTCARNRYSHHPYLQSS